MVGSFFRLSDLRPLLSVMRRPENLKAFRDLGAIYMTLTHFGHNALGDSSNPRAELGDPQEEHGGLSELGRQVVNDIEGVRFRQAALFPAAAPPQALDLPELANVAARIRRFPAVLMVGDEHRVSAASQFPDQVGADGAEAAAWLKANPQALASWLQGVTRRDGQPPKAPASLAAND